MCDIVNLCIKNGMNSSLGPYIDKNNMYKLVRQSIDIKNIHLNIPTAYYNNMNHTSLTKSKVSGVLKGTHLSGSVILLQDGKFVKCLKRVCTGESAYVICNNLITKRQKYHVEEKMYGSIVPGCILEPFRKRDIEYKWFCIRGDCPIMTATFYTSRAYFTNEKTLIKWLGRNKKAETYVKLLSNTTWDAMKKVSRDVSKKFTFVRVDFSTTNNKLYLDDLTFTTTACTYLIRQPQKYLSRINYKC